MTTIFKTIHRCRCGQNLEVTSPGHSTAKWVEATPPFAFRIEKSMADESPSEEAYAGLSSRISGVSERLKDVEIKSNLQHEAAVVQRRAVRKLQKGLAQELLRRENLDRRLAHLEESFWRNK